MLIAGFPAGPWGTNCYVVSTGTGNECLIIDPGKDAAPGIDEIVREHNLRPVAVLVTHGHLDHMWSLTPVCQARDVPAYIHPDDRHLLSDPMAAMSGETRQMFDSMTGGVLTFTEPDDVRLLADNSTISVAGIDIGIRHAPGHTPGSTVFLTDADGDFPPIMYSGDLLFEGSIGRTDLPGGDTAQMMRSLARVVLPQPPEMVVLPGHGAQTSVGRELASNPFLSEARETPMPRRGL